METLPHDLNAEMALLGEIITEGSLSYANQLVPEDFYKDSHKIIFEAMKEMDEKGEHIDFVTLNNYLMNKDILQDTGGTSYLMELSEKGIYTNLKPDHIRIVKQEAIKRQIMEKSMNVREGLKDADISQIISDMRTFYEGIALTPTLENIGFFDMDKVFEEGKAYAQRGKETGIEELDRIIKIMPAELIIIGARVRHGKSSLAYNFLLNFLEKYKDETFIFFNLDVKSVYVATRLATIWARKHNNNSYGYKDILPHYQDEKEDKMPEEILSKAFPFFHECGEKKRLAIINTPNYTVEQLIGHAEILARQKPLGAIFVDYIELIKTDKKQDTEELRIAHIVNQLRIASERLSCPVIALAQMNRTVSKEKKPEKRRPNLEGLRYSGRQEQEASTVLGLFNINVEKIEINQEDGVFNTPDTETTLEIIPLKNRGGISNRIIELDFDMKSGYIKTKEKQGFGSYYK
jgi:replicative DNA helicase